MAAGVGNGDAEIHTDPSLFLQLPEQIKIANRKRTLGYDPDRISVRGTDFKASPGQAKGGLEGLITISVAGKHNQLTVPGSLLKRLLEEIRSTALQYDL